MSQIKNLSYFFIVSFLIILPVFSRSSVDISPVVVDVGRSSIVPVSFFCPHANGCGEIEVTLTRGDIDKAVFSCETGSKVLFQQEVVQKCEIIMREAGNFDFDAQLKYRVQGSGDSVEVFSFKISSREPQEDDGFGKYIPYIGAVIVGLFILAIIMALFGLRKKRKKTIEI